MAAEHGGAMAVGGEAVAALPELGRWRKCKHNLKEGEAELRARDCWPRWRSRGGFRQLVRGAARQRQARGGRPARRWARPRRGEARGAAGCWLGRLRSWAKSEAAAREGGKSLFQIYFQGIFKCHLSNFILSKKMTSFENVPKMKVA